MSTQYFEDCSDLDAARALFRTLAKRLHPDMQGGNSAEFRAMLDEFQAIQAGDWTRGGKAKFGDDYESGKSFDLSPDMAAKIMRAAGMSDVHVEIMGTWAWATGDTRAHAGEFKSDGWRFAPRKAAWCYHEDHWRRRHKREFTLDEIRAMHGSADVRRNTGQGAQLSA